MVISIHALVKRATLMREHYDLVDFISIHALVKRATAISHSLFISALISIHALVKRATDGNYYSHAYIAFQSTPS